jgi:hypothetical protein
VMLTDEPMLSMYPDTEQPAAGISLKTARG